MKLNVFVAFFPYAGNSTGSSMVFDVTQWFVQLSVRVKNDPRFTSRIGEFMFESFCDTPITMTRNRAVEKAQQVGADVIMMVDSDMRPDVRLGSDPTAVPFFDAAFDAIYEHYRQGPLVIAAPYGGTPPHENMFVFKWASKMNAGQEAQFSLEQYSREEAYNLHGIQEAAALPTGLIMYDLRAFDLITHPYFHYEWESERESKKASTEDVQNTRDIGLSGVQCLGYNPLRCAWSSWAGHLKVWCVDKPELLTTANVSDNLKKAIDRSGARVVDIGHKWVEVRKKAQLALVHDHKTPIEHMDAVVDLINDKCYETVIEVGTWNGRLARHIIDNTDGVKLTCVDHFQGCESDWTSDLAQERDIYAEWKHRMGDDAHLCDMDSAQAADLCSDADLIIIDTDHSYESTLAEIERWWPKVNPGGALIGHDYNTKDFPGVNRAVDEAFGGKARAYGMTDRGGFWLVHKDGSNEPANSRRAANA